MLSSVQLASVRGQTEVRARELDWWTTAGLAGVTPCNDRLRHGGEAAGTSLMTLPAGCRELQGARSTRANKTAEEMEVRRRTAANSVERGRPDRLCRTQSSRLPAGSGAKIPIDGRLLLLSFAFSFSGFCVFAGP